MDSYFWFGKNVENLLFKGFNVNSNGGLIGLCLMISLMAFVFEYLKYLQSKYKQQELLWRVKQLRLWRSSETASLLDKNAINRTNYLNSSLFDRALLCGVELSLWVIVTTLGYFLMLIIMVYNGWFLISAMVGSGIGYFIFGHQFMRMNIQNCNIMRSTICKQLCGGADTTSKEGQSTPVAQDTPSTSHTDLDCHRRTTPNELTVQVECH